MKRPFRFGLQTSRLPSDWAELARRIEDWGFDSLCFPDHFTPMVDPIAAQAAVAAVTRRLRVASLVYSVDYRHPAVLAKAAATIHLLSGGRHEFGIGAGWTRTDYEEAGIPYDPPSVRIERLEEALQIIRAMWEPGRSSFEGRHYHIREIDQAAELPEGEAPPVLVGGGGRKLLSVAGRHADIVGINPKIPEGRVTAETAADSTAERTREKVRWVREAAEAAGRDPEAIELQSLVFVTALVDDPSGIRQALARNSELSEAEVAESPLYLTGPAAEVRDSLERRREEFGISYVVVQAHDLDVVEQFAERVVAPLAGK